MSSLEVINGGQNPMQSHKQQPLSEHDKFAIRRWLLGLDVDTQHVSARIADLVRNLSHKNPSHHQTMTEIFMPYMAEIAAADPYKPPSAPQRPALLSYADFEADFVMPDYLAPGLAVYDKALNMLFGFGGSGKSLIAIHYACQIAVGAPVLYIAAEAQAATKARIKAWAEHYRQRPEYLFLWQDPLDLMDNRSVAQLIGAVNQPLKLVVLDTISHSMSGDENQTQDMRQAVSACQTIMRELNAGMLVIHHSNRQGDSRGSLHLYNSCDSVLKAVKDEAQVTVFNDHDKGGKNRNLPEENPVHFGIVQTLVTDSADKQMSVGVIVPSEEFADSPRYGLNKSDQAILELLRGFPNGLTKRELAEADIVSTATVYRRLPLLLQSGHVRLDDEGRYFCA